MQIDLPKLDKRVVIKGYRTGIGIFFDEDSPFPDLLADLGSSLDRSNAFFDGAPVTLHIGRRELGMREFMALRDLLVERHRLMIAQVHADTPSTRAAAERLGLKVSGTPAPAPRPVAAVPAPARDAANGAGAARVEVPRAEPERPAPDGPDQARGAWRPEEGGAARPEGGGVPRSEGSGAARSEGSGAPRSDGSGAGSPAADTLTVRQTLRSGQRVEFPGHVLVLGDVNSGAEIVAGGDIVVFGALRGLAHAGASGDGGAVIVALGIQPPQLRIGAVISRGSGGPARRDGREAQLPEIARVEGGTIVVESFRGRL